MASTMVPNTAVPSMLPAGWLTADTSGPDRSGRVPVIQDNTAPAPNPKVPISDGVVDLDVEGLNAGGIGEPWEPSTSFPWPATPSTGSGVVAVLPGSTGDGNTNDDPSGMPGYDGPRLRYGGAYAETGDNTGHDALAQTTDTHGFNQYTVALDGYPQQNTRLMGNTSPGYVNVWDKIWNVTPPVKTANQFTAQPFTNMDGSEGTLPAYADLSLANSGGQAYYLNGPEAPSTVDAQPSATGSAPDPAAGWA